MHLHQGLRSRTLILVVINALSVSMLVGAAGAESSTNDLEADPSRQLLVNLVYDILDSDQATVVRELGAGWVLVEANDGQPNLGALLDELGIVWESNTIYELLADPLFGDQWGLENTGQLGGTVDADIDAPDAWVKSTGDPGQIIAIIDSGVDLDHPDLVDRIWTNPGEIPGNSFDDDGNGYIDDVNGWDTLVGDNDPNDEFWHGTAVAGAAAASSNSIGVLGVAPQATIMPIRACNNSCPLSAIVEGIHYAINNGAQIINLSLGSHTPNQSLVDAIAAANDAGVLVVTAAGNDGANNETWPFYPANIDLPNIVSVAATDRNDSLAVFTSGGSNYGALTVDLAAPGKDIVTTGIGGWVQASGTSFAAPMVAGAAAIVGSIRPTASASEIRQILLDTVDILASLQGKTVTGGRLNLASAATVAGYPVAVATVSPSQGTMPLTVTLDGTSSYDPNGSIVNYEWQLPDGSTLSGAVVAWDPPTPGIHKVTLVVTDNDGSRSQDNVQIKVNTGPVAVASGSPVLGWEPLTVQLSGAYSTDPDGALIDWAWSSGSAVASGAETSIVLDTVGIHEVTLTVTDDAGSTGSATFEVLVGTDFLDTRTSIFRLDIAWMSALGITKGCDPPNNDNYCPQSRVTRGQMAAFIARSLSLPSSSVDYFTDDNGSIFEPDINRLAAAGITKGCNPPANDEYCPAGGVTREQVAAFIARAFDLPTAPIDYFTDDNGSIFEPDINRLAAAGITKGCNPPANDEYCPTNGVTRGEMAAFMRRADT